MLGINERTMRRYCLSEYPIPKHIELAIKFLVNTQ